MTSSIAIPTTSNPARKAPSGSPGSASSFASSSLSPSSYTEAIGSYDDEAGSSSMRLSKEAKGKGKQMNAANSSASASSSPLPPPLISPVDVSLDHGQPDRWAASPFRRRASLMGKEIERTEHIVVDVGSPEAPRLISCVASSQGFDWNRSIFLPRYITGDDGSLEHRQDPIEDIIITDEEARELLPQW